MRYVSSLVQKPENCMVYALSLYLDEALNQIPKSLSEESLGKKSKKKYQKFLP